MISKRISRNFDAEEDNIDQEIDSDLTNIEEENTKRVVSLKYTVYCKT
jgi:hypothetical protein